MGHTLVLAIRAGVRGLVLRWVQAHPARGGPAAAQCTCVWSGGGAGGILRSFGVCGCAGVDTHALYFITFLVCMYVLFPPCAYPFPSPYAH